MAKQEEIRTRITVDDQATKKLKEVADAEESVENATDKIGDASETTSRKTGGLGSAFAALRTTVGGVVTALVGLSGVGGLLDALRSIRTEMDANAESAKKLKEAQLDLQFLSQNLNPSELAAVEQAATLKGGRGQLIAMSGAFAEFKSQTAQLTDQQRIDWFRQMVETSMTTSASPTELVGLFAGGSRYVQDPNRFQNVARKLQELSTEASPSALAKLLPTVMEPGTVAGMSIEEIGGLLTESMGVTLGRSEVGARSLGNLFTILSGKSTSEQLEAAGINPAASKRLLSQYGVVEGATFRETLGKLADASKAGKFGLTEAEAIAGRENMTVLLGLTSRFDQVNATIAKIQQAGLSNVDLTSQALKNIGGPGGDFQQRLRYVSEQNVSKSELVKSKDKRSQTIGTVQDVIRRMALESGATEGNMLDFSVSQYGWAGMLHLGKDATDEELLAWAEEMIQSAAFKYGQAGTGPMRERRQTAREFARQALVPNFDVSTIPGGTTNVGTINVYGNANPFDEVKRNDLEQ